MIFLIAYLMLSGMLDLYYYNRVLQKGAGQEGQISYSDFRVFWFAAYDIRHHILREQTSPPRFKHLWFFCPADIRAELKTATGPGDEHIVYKRNEEFYHFRYSPFIAFIMIPLGKIGPQGNALFVWYGILNVMFLSALLLLIKQLTTDFYLSRIQSCIVLLVTFLMTLRFYMTNLSLGQTDICVALLFVLFLMAYLRKRDMICGILLALIFQMKPFFAPILFYLLLSGRMKIILSALIVFAASLLAPAYMLGMEKTVQLTRDWLDILRFSIPSQISLAKNQSLAHLISYAGQNAVYLISACVTISFYAGLALMKKLWGGRDCRFSYMEVSFFIFVSLLFSPIAWEAHFINLVIPVAIVTTLVMKGAGSRFVYTAVGLFFILSCLGSDFTKFIDFANVIHNFGLPLGTISLLFAMIHAYRRSRLQRILGL